MDKTSIIGATAAVLVLVGWQYYQAKHQPLRPQPAQIAAETSGTMGTEPSAASTPGAELTAPATTTAAAAQTPPVPVPPAEAKTETFSTKSADYVFTNLGGGIAKAVLKNYPGANGGSVALNERGTIPIGTISSKAGEGTSEPATMTVRGNVVSFEQTLPGQVHLTKTFIMPQGDKGLEEYLIKLEVAMTNRGDKPFSEANWFLHLGSAVPVHETDLPTNTAFNWLRMGKLHDTTSMAFDAGKIPLIGIQTRAARAEISETTDQIAWAGVRSQYFTSLVTPPKGLATTTWSRRFDFKLTPESGKTLHGIDGALGFPAAKLAPGETWKQEFQLYVGPKEFTRLKKMKADEDRIMNFGMFRLVSETLLSAMHRLKGWLGSYAVAIIVLTLIIKTMLWPLQNAATRSMKRMQLLQPKMTALKEKYKDDPTRMNQEVMKLYKDYGINPFSGCLPMLIQIPIFFGFYSMLGSAIELRNSSFFWVHDLSQPDTIAHLFGIPINVLPLLMAGTMFWQMAISPKSGDPVQQRVFMFMPLMFVFFCYNFASALALYWTVQNLFSIVQLYATRNQALPVLEKKAAPPAKRPRR
jgi:YidC/Oxa1 family membrane protein insertase